MKNLIKKAWKLAAALSVFAFLFTVWTRIPAMASPVEAVLAHYFSAHNAHLDGVQVNGPWIGSNGTMLTSSPVLAPIASTSLSVTASYEVVDATATAIMTSLPTIATTYTDVASGRLRNFTDGALLILSSTNTVAVTLQDNSLLAGSDLYLSSQTVVLQGPGAAATNLSGAAPIKPLLQFRFDSLLPGWVEVH
ncbi:MAG: hypothetical protein KGJ13_02295 [Patescibacteria group bacterium]|nr:hypothetical protein [Patescibacteria group bacterium]